MEEDVNILLAKEGWNTVEELSLSMYVEYILYIYIVYTNVCWYFSVFMSCLLKLTVS